MSEYRMRGIIDIHDLDYNGIAKTSAILKFMQSAAEMQLTDNGMSYASLKDKGHAFILSRLKLEVLKPLTAYQPITAITYPCESRGYGFLRCYALESMGVTVARAISVWALINTNSHSLIKCSDFDLGLALLPPLNLELDRTKMPSTLIDIGKYGVHYGDVDQNRHMNNTKYADMFSNYLPLEGKMIKSINLHFVNEAVLGEKLRVQSATVGGSHYFRTIRADGKINSDTEIILSDI